LAAQLGGKEAEKGGKGGGELWRRWEGGPAFKAPSLENFKEHYKMEDRADKGLSKKNGEGGEERSVTDWTVD